MTRAAVPDRLAVTRPLRAARPTAGRTTGGGPRRRWPPAPDTALGRRPGSSCGPTAAADAPALVRRRSTTTRVWAHLAATPASPARRRRAAGCDPGRGRRFPWTLRLAAGRRPRPRRAVVGWSSFLEVSAADARCEIGNHRVRPGRLGEPGQPRGEAAAARPRVRRPRAWVGCSSRPTSATSAPSRPSPASARGARGSAPLPRAPTARSATPCCSRSPPRSGRRSGTASSTGCRRTSPGLDSLRVATGPRGSVPCRS